MPINKAVLAAFKAATRLRPDIREFYKTQRLAEDVSAKLVLPNPRCRIDEAFATMPDGFEVPLRVFTPLDFDFSLAEGLKVSEDSRGTVLFFHGGGWVNGTVDFYIDACTTMAIQLERRVVCPRTPLPPGGRGLLRGGAPAVRGHAAGGCRPRERGAVRRQRGRQPGGSAVAHGARPRRLPAAHADAAVPRHVQRPRPVHVVVRLGARERRGLPAHLARHRRLHGPVPLGDFDDPYFAPLLDPDLSRQPRTLVISAEYCPLRDEAEAYAARLELEGDQEVQCYRMLDAVHGYLLYPSVLSLVKDTYRIIKHFLDGDDLTQEGEPTWLGILGTD